MKEIKALAFNMGYVLAANISSLLISVFIALFVPRFIGVADYGFWELYLMYSSYAGFFHLGWVDGLLLRFAGKGYEQLDYPLFRRSGRAFLLLQLLILVLLISISNVFQLGNFYVLVSSSLLIIVLNLRVYNTYLLQATNRIRDFSAVIFVGNLTFIVGLILVIWTGLSFQKLILADLLSKIISLIYSYYLTHEIHFTPRKEFASKRDESILWTREVKLNIFAGLPLTVAYVISILITGTYRFAIELYWGIEQFAQISLALNLSSFILVFVSAIGVAVFPALKKVDEGHYKNLFSKMNYWMTVSLFLLMSCYFIGKPLLHQWLPNYDQGIGYLTYLFPIFIFQSKNALINTTFLKAMRQEKFIVKQNLITVLLSLILTYISVELLASIEMVIVCILISNLFLAMLGEWWLGARFKMPQRDLMLEELFATFGFILVAYYWDSFLAAIIYAGMVLLIFRPDFKTLKTDYRQLSRET